MLNTGQSLVISVHGEEVRKGVPLSLLSVIFSGLQETVYFIATAESGFEWRPRMRVSIDIQEAYQLMRVGEHSSVYTVEVAFAEPIQARLPLEPDESDMVLDKYFSLLDALSDSNNERVFALLPDIYWRRRILHSVQTYCPKKEDQWYLTVNREATGREVKVSARSRARIGELLSRPSVEETTVSGELLRVHLDEHKIGIHHETAKRLLDCYYSPDLEDFIVENLKGIVHVTGRVELDSDGLPHRIVDVTDIRALDLSPLVLKTIETPKETLILGERQVIEPSFEDDHVVFKLPDLNIVATGETRDDAIEKLCSDFAWLWKEYVLAPPEGLSQDAKDLAEHLRAMVKD
jgi:hypothetical protein